MRFAAKPVPGLYPFWFWNGIEEEQEIERQLKLMADVGCRGVALHSRTGNKIEYLSPRWMELVRCACRCAKGLGLKVWLYDEDGFPSGNAGRNVQRLHPELVQKNLRYDYSGTDPDHPAFAAYDAVTFQKLDESAVPKGTPALRFFKVLAEIHVDTLNPESAKHFIALTHERYFAELEEFFGDPIEAVYTDDESYILCSNPGLAWSEVLEREYLAAYGRPLEEILPLLVENLPGSGEARRDFYALVQKLFLQNFIAPQWEWCRKHGVAYIGHLAGDEGNFNIYVKNFGSPMPYYMEEDVPSIDDYLCDMKDFGYLRRTHNDAITRWKDHGVRRFPVLFPYKNAASIAHQFKGDLFSSETLTYLSWNCTPDFQDLQTMFEVGMGVNLMTPHAFYYTVGDGTKKDCPPSYSFQQPCYPDSAPMIRKWTRSADLLLRGKFHADTLLVFPAGVWRICDGTELDPHFRRKTEKTSFTLDAVEHELANAMMNLMRHHIGFDLGDEFLMQEKGVVGKGTLTLGSMAYSTVVLATELPLEAGTRELLDSFRAAGGRVVSASPEELDRLVPDVRISGSGTEEILVHARDNNGFRELFLLNLSGRDLAPRFSVDSAFCLYDPEIDRIVFRGDSLPEGFLLREGASVFVLPASLEREAIPFEESIYLPFGNESAEPVLRSVRPLNENILAFHHVSDLTLNLPEEVRISSVYGEKIRESGMRVNGLPVDAAPIPSHPADPCYTGIRGNGVFRPGTNRLTFEREIETLYLGGTFQVISGEDNSFFFGSTKPGYGNLAEQGYPFYWGAMEYEFEFEGVFRFLKLDLDGSAEVSINGNSCGVIVSRPYLLNISDFCLGGRNSLKIVLRNIAQNFICADQPAPFGIRRATLWK